MADLATLSGRRTAQRRITNNRDGVLPARRNTEAPAVAIRADMRAATRGDGGADELRRILDDFTGAVTAAGNAKTLNDMDGFRQDAADGSLAAVGGDEIDPAQARSLAYREAFYRVRAEAQFNDFTLETRAAVEEALNQGMGPDEVEALVLERVTAFRDRVIETIPSATAQRETAGRLSQLGNGLDQEIATTIRERTRQELVETHQGNIGAALRSGEALSFESYVRTFIDGGLPPDAAKKAAMEAVMAVALDRDDPNPELLSQLLSSTREDGKTPSLSAGEQLMIQDRITQARALEDQVEREQREDRRDELLSNWFDRAVKGEIVDEEIVAAGVEGLLEPQEVAQYIGLTNGLRDAVEEGHADEDFALEVEQRIVLGNPPSNAQILSWQREGRFGTGRAGLRASVQALGSATSARRAAAGGGVSTGLTSRQARAQQVTMARAYLMGALDPGADASRYQRSMRTRAGLEFNRRVVAGEDPMTVADSLIEPFGSRIERGTPDRTTRSRGGGTASAPTTTLRYDAEGRLIR